MGVWARYSVWLHAGIVLFGLIVGVPIGIALGGLLALGKYHLLTMHTNPRAIPTVLWGLRHSHAFLFPMAIGALVGAATGIGALYALMMQGTSLFGEARFATSSDMRKSGLFRNQGAIIGRQGGRWLRAEPEDNVMCNAPPRSGKGVGFVIPNLLMLDYSAVCLDIRGENFANSARYRQEDLGQEVFVVDPLNRDGKTHCFNPLSFIRRNDPIEVIEELQRIAVQLFPYPLQGNPFFIDAARDGFTGIGCLVAAEQEHDFTIANIFTILSGDPRKALFKKVQELEAQIAMGQRPVSSGAIDLLKSFCAHTDETYKNVSSSIQSKLGLFANPRVAMATRRSDFDLRDLRSKRITVYLCSGPSDLDVLAPLYNLMFQQIVSLNSREEFRRTEIGFWERLEEVDAHWRRGGMPFGKIWKEGRKAWLGLYRPIERNSLRCLLILDEFKRLGKMDVLADAMSYMGGFGISICPVIQSHSQLQEVYGPYGANTILTCCATNLVLRPNTQSEAETISKQLGDNGISVKNRSTTRYGMFASGGNSSIGSVSESLSRRPLLYPKEVLEMPRQKGLIFKAGQSAVLFNRIEYYKMGVLKRRAKLGGTELPVQDIEEYYAYMAKQRHAGVAALVESGQDNEIEDDDDGIDFDFKEEHLKSFDDIDKGQGEFAPGSSLDATLKAMQNLVKDTDASAYRKQLKEQMSQKP